ncbi:MAG: Hpt domain-containing protein [Planctomycetota bacterium]|nr:Hpt domain-containing protein [Planctomycetota bacterium]MDA1213083.1 Hpt domain-containing protein [Planctomycetota bacterium]
MDDDILEEFLAECWENLAGIDNQIVTLEMEPNNVDLLASIFRTIHTIKGTCGFIGLAGLGHLAHATENVIGQMREHLLSVTPCSISIVHEAVDEIRSFLRTLEATGQEPRRDTADLIERLSNLALRGNPASSDVSPAGEADVDDDPRIINTIAVSALNTPNTSSGISDITDTKCLSATQNGVFIANETDLVFTPECDLPQITGKQVHLVKSCDDSKFDHRTYNKDLTRVIENPPAPSLADSSPLLNSKHLQQSFELFAPQSDRLAKRFFEKLIKDYPAYKAFFVHTNFPDLRQQFIQLLAIVVKSANRPVVLTRLLHDLCLRHIEYGISRSDYASFRTTLLAVLEEFAGSQWTDELQSAWEDTIAFIAEQMQSAGLRCPGTRENDLSSESRVGVTLNSNPFRETT